MDSTKLDAHIQACIAAFRPISFPKGFGFDAHEFNELKSFFNDETQWGIALKKERGRGILYGRCHAHWRQSVLNGLDVEDRLAVMAPKLDYYHVLDKLHVVDVHLGPFSLVDIVDIGMGHSVYCITIRHEADGSLKRWVIKQEEWASQSFFSQILSALDWPTYVSGHVRDGFGCWEVSEYLGDVGLTEAYLAADDVGRSDLDRQLARHAALGDVLGRGDRHFENYIVRDGVVYPIDISYLFWPDNDDWVFKYASAGMSEVCGVSLYFGDYGCFEERLSAFFVVYCDALAELAAVEGMLCERIDTFFGDKSPDLGRKIDYVRSRLRDVESVQRRYEQLYREALVEMRRRSILKGRLSGKVEKDAAFLDTNSLLKMYYLADLGRLSAFYLSEGHTLKELIS